MADEDKGTPSHGINLADYVHRSQAKAREDELLDAIETLTKEGDAAKAKLAGFDKHGDPSKLSDRVKELEGKLRGRAHRDAFDAIAEKLRVKPEFRDDVFDLAKFEQAKDEPDPKAMGKRLKEWLDERESRSSYLDAAEDAEGDAAAKGNNDDNPFGQLDRSKPKGKVKLHTEDSDDETGARRGRGTPQPGATKFRYRETDLSNPDWMRDNGLAFSRAMTAGNAVKIA